MEYFNSVMVKGVAAGGVAEIVDSVFGSGVSFKVLTTRACNADEAGFVSDSLQEVATRYFTPGEMQELSDEGRGPVLPVLVQVVAFRDEAAWACKKVRDGRVVAVVGHLCSADSGFVVQADNISSLVGVNDRGVNPGSLPLWRDLIFN